MLPGKVKQTLLKRNSISMALKLFNWQSISIWIHFGIWYIGIRKNIVSCPFPLSLPQHRWVQKLAITCMYMYQSKHTISWWTHTLGYWLANSRTCISLKQYLPWFANGCCNYSLFTEILHFYEVDSYCNLIVSWNRLLLLSFCSWTVILVIIDSRV